MTNIQIRVILGVIIGLLFILSIFIFRPLFYVVMYLVALMMLIEWYKITNQFLLYNYLGLIVVPMPIVSIMLISVYDKLGWVLITYFAIIWVVDTMAMFGGKLIKGPKLAPRLSPKKTFSGLFVGVVCGMFVPYLLKLLPGYNLIYFTIDANIKMFIYCFIFAMLAQASDLFVSFFKRKSKIKDSGNIIPAHGGMLDRFDSIILTAPVLFLYLNSNLV